MSPAVPTKDIYRLPILAIVGRPNVGKSTLFNRLVGERKAIVHDLPGITRDRNYAVAEWYGTRYLVLDTGGFEPKPETELKKQIQAQSRRAIEEADVILFLFDGKGGLNPLDRDAVQMLRVVEKPVFFAVNKIDVKAKESLLYEFYHLGLDEIFPLSAEHGLGLSELMDRIVRAFPVLPAEDGSQEREKAGPLCLAIVGRPNVGKSTLVNRLLGYERSVVDPTPGTTRDAVDSPFDWEGESYLLVDTAGIRRKAKVADQVERYSVKRALGSVDRGDLIVYLIDGVEGIASQDSQILSYAVRRGKGIILAVNKWDLIATEYRDSQALSDALYRKLPFVDYAPLALVSALTGFGIRRMMELVRLVSTSYRSQVRTSALNQLLRSAVEKYPPPSSRGRPVRLYYGTQTATAPPTFTFFVTAPKGITASYQRYLSRELRHGLGLEGAPIRLVFRARREERRER